MDSIRTFRIGTRSIISKVSSQGMIDFIGEPLVSIQWPDFQPLKFGRRLQYPLRKPVTTMILTGTLGS